MSKLTSIDPVERLSDWLSQRDPELARQELARCNLFLLDDLEGLAKECPGCVGIGGVSCGMAVGIFCMTQSAEGFHYSVEASGSMRLLAHLIASFPPELIAIVQIELNHILKRRELERQMDEAVEEALRIAAGARPCR